MPKRPLNNIILSTTKVKFIHTADLHLDTPFRGLTVWNPALSKKLKDATFRSFSRIIDLCLEREVDFLIISGDVFDNENKSLAAQLRFASELKRLGDKGIPTYFVCGNHDPFDEVKASQLPDNVYCFNPHMCEYKSFRRGGGAVADIHGISFKEVEVNQNLAKTYNLASDPAKVSIAVLHGSVGSLGQHEIYAPFSMEDIKGKGFDYWALGHIHKSQVINLANPAVVYPGNPQGRDFGETGEKGCYCVTIRDNDEPELEFIPTQMIRFENIDIDLTGVDNMDQLKSKIDETIDQIDDGKVNLILRVTLQGRTILHQKLNEKGEASQLLDLFNEDQFTEDIFVWIDTFIIKTKPDIDIQNIRKGTGFPADILKVHEAYIDYPDKLRELFLKVENDFSNPMAKRLMDELSEADRKEILEKAATILIDKLLEEQ